MTRRWSGHSVGLVAAATREKKNHPGWFAFFRVMNGRISSIVLSGWICGLACSASAQTNTPGAPPAGASGMLSNIYARVRAPLSKVPPLASWPDRMHDKLYHDLDNTVKKVDVWFVHDGQAAYPITNSTFDLECYIKLQYSGGRLDVEGGTDFQADLQLPNIARKMHVFVSDRAPDRLHGSDPLKQPNEIFLGLRNVFDLGWMKDVHMKVGVKGRIPPAVFSELKFRPELKYDTWRIYPEQKVFWFSDDRLGEMTTVQIDKWLNRQTVLRTVTAAKWTETSTGVEWTESLILGYVLEGTIDDPHRAVGSRIVITGHKTSEIIVDQYRWENAYRFPLRKRWLYLSIIPTVEWNREDNWEPSHFLELGINMMFWGSDER